MTGSQHRALLQAIHALDQRVAELEAKTATPDREQQIAEIGLRNVVNMELYAGDHPDLWHA